MTKRTTTPHAANQKVSSRPRRSESTPARPAPPPQDDDLDEETSASLDQIGAAQDSDADATRTSTRPLEGSMEHELEDAREAADDRGGDREDAALTDPTVRASSPGQSGSAEGDTAERDTAEPASGKRASAKRASAKGASAKHASGKGGATAAQRGGGAGARGRPARAAGTASAPASRGTAAARKPTPKRHAGGTRASTTPARKRTKA